MAIAEKDVMTGLKSVSYTHLDVYKRQVFTSEPTTCRWCLLAARSKCRPVAGFHELRIGNV